MVLPMDVPRVVAASDAALDRQGSGGYHLVFQDGNVQVREAFVAIIPSQVGTRRPQDRPVGAVHGGARPHGEARPILRETRSVVH